MDALGNAEQRSVLHATLAVASGRSASDGPGSAAAAQVLAAAEFRNDEDWAPAALERLGRYTDVVAGAPTGCDLATRLGQARLLFGAGLYFEVHEVLEPVWLEAEPPPKGWLQGLIQAAVAWHHFDAANQRGALSLAEAATEKLRAVPPVWLGFEASVVAESIEAFASWLRREEGGVEPERPWRGGRA